MLDFDLKEIVNGRLYDTTQAEFIGYSEYSHRGDFYWHEEALYRTPKGSFFLAGQGGALSPYSEPVTHSESKGGRRIRPLSREEALAWAEVHLGDVDEITELFSDLVEVA